MQCIALCAVLWIQGKCVYESVLQSELNKNDLVASACNLYKKEILKVFFSHLITSFKKTEMKISFLTNTGLPLLYFVTHRKKNSWAWGSQPGTFFQICFHFFFLWNDPKPPLHTQLTQITEVPFRDSISRTPSSGVLLSGHRSLNMSKIYSPSCFPTASAPQTNIWPLLNKMQITLSVWDGKRSESNNEIISFSISEIHGSQRQHILFVTMMGKKADYFGSLSKIGANLKVIQKEITYC